MCTYFEVISTSFMTFIVLGTLYDPLKDGYHSAQANDSSEGMNTF